MTFLCVGSDIKNFWFFVYILRNIYISGRAKRAYACFDEQNVDCTSTGARASCRATASYILKKILSLLYGGFYILYFVYFSDLQLLKHWDFKPRPILNAVRQGHGMVIGQQLFLTYRGLDARRLARAAEEHFE